MVGKALDKEESRERKTDLDLMAVTPSRLGERSYQVKENSDIFGCGVSDCDPDCDTDKEKIQQSGSADGETAATETER